MLKRFKFSLVFSVALVAMVFAGSQAQAAPIVGGFRSLDRW